MLDLNLNTPTEEYTVAGKTVYVKRDDLVGDGVRYPKWGKMYAIQRVVESLDKDTPLIHLTVGQSYSGWALAACAKEVGLKVYLTCPNNKTTGPLVKPAVDYGAELIPLRPNMTNIMRNQTHQIARERGYQTIPYGFAVEAFFQGIADRIRTVDKEYNSVVVSVGTGGCLVGVALGVGNKPVYGISVSALPGPQKIVDTRLPDATNITLIKSPHKFEKPLNDVAPFPTNPFWDAKAWLWLTENIESLVEPVLFYNIGE